MSLKLLNVLTDRLKGPFGITISISAISKCSL